MAPKPELGRLAFVFGMVLAVALTILAIMTWMDPDLAAPNPPTKPIPIYQPQHLNVYKAVATVSAAIKLALGSLRARVE